jgi:hypothetical protein
MTILGELSVVSQMEWYSDIRATNDHPDLEFAQKLVPSPFLVTAQKYPSLLLSSSILDPEKEQQEYVHLAFLTFVPLVPFIPFVPLVPFVPFALFALPSFLSRNFY